MQIRIIEEAGHTAAVTGLKFSMKPECNLGDIEEVKYASTKTSRTLASKDGGHNKFLESIMVWMDIKAPLYWWKQFDTYRIGVTKQSKSTMHTLMKRSLTEYDFTGLVTAGAIFRVNCFIREGNFESAIANLPDGYLQTRRVCLSYKTIRHILKQRKHHKLNEWAAFMNFMQMNLKHPELLGGDIV